MSALGPRDLVEHAATIRRSGDAQKQAELARKLIDMARRIGDPAWREGQRRDIEAANESNWLAPTAAQVEAQLTAWQDQNLKPILAALEELGGDLAVDFALDEAQNESLSLERRAAALRVADRNVSVSDRVRTERRATIAADLARRAAEKGSGPGYVSNASTVVASMAKGFRRCYNQALVKAPDLEVKGRLTLKLDATGGVASVQSADLAPVEFADCLVGVARTARFSPPEGGGATIVVPLTFMSKK